MATNRVRIKRAVRSRATDEARAIYKDAVKLQDVRWDCIRGVACRSSSPVKHCERCAKYIGLSQELSSLLGTKPWETCPLDAVRENPPDWMRGNPQQCEYWHKAWALRCELKHE